MKVWDVFFIRRRCRKIFIAVLVAVGMISVADVLFLSKVRYQNQTDSSRYSQDGPTGNIAFTAVIPGTSGHDVEQKYTAPPADEERIARRLRIAQEFCSSNTDKSQLNFLTSNNLVISETTKFLHCPLGKAASTFWSRFVLSLTPSGKMASPFEFPFEPPGNTPDKRFKSLSKTARRQYHAQATKNIFVRDPYHRFFSAYVDKVFAPNPTYWKHWGVSSIKRFRPGVDRTKVTCGHDATFSEVLSLIAKVIHKKDAHVQPAFSVCQPCGVKYDVIGKMETFVDDLRYVSHRLNLSLIDYFGSKQFRDDFAKDAIRDSVLSPFSWMKDISVCMTKLDAGLRIWRKLQIRGIVSRSILFPYTAEEFENVTAEQFIQAAMKAYLRSDPKQLKKQKRDAFLEAYSSVSSKDLQTLKDLYRQEFAVFDYNPEPPEVFRAKEFQFSTGAFDLEKQWTASS